MLHNQRVFCSFAFKYTKQIEFYSLDCKIKSEIAGVLENNGNGNNNNNNNNKSLYGHFFFHDTVW
jgi:hypothetical protein